MQISHKAEAPPLPQLPPGYFQQMPMQPPLPGIHELHLVADTASMANMDERLVLAMIAAELLTVGPMRLKQFLSTYHT